MTTARQIITSALTTGLNRLSAGETLEPDLAAQCLSALNDVVDGINGAGGMLWKQTASTQTITGSSALLSLWGLTPGASITLVTHAGWPVNPTTYEAFQSIVIGSTGVPTVYALSGLSMHFYPAPVALPITVTSKEAAEDFSDLDTDYVMPKGWRSGLASLLAEKVAEQVVGQLPVSVAREASAARRRMLSIEPAIINPGLGGDALSAFFRGY